VQVSGQRNIALAHAGCDNNGAEKYVQVLD
jgi:hypothetical protein